MSRHIPGIFRLALAVLFVCAFAVQATAGPVVIHVYTALSPNGYGSPSYAAWQQNAVDAMKAGGALTQGTAGAPSYFYQGSDFTAAEVTVTSFHSWMGQADPGAVFGAEFENELGNRMMFPLWIDGDGTLFSISMLSMTMDSTDPEDGLDYAYNGGYNYSAGYVGLNWGPDQIRGTGDEFWVTGGASTQLVNELFGRGSGNSFWPCYGEACTTIEQQQAAIDETALYPGTPFQFTGTYTLALPETGSVSGQATFNIRPVPDGGATLTLLGCALVGLGALRRKFRS